MKFKAGRSYSVAFKEGSSAVDSHTSITLLNPAVAMVLASVFFLFWWFRRHKVHLAVLAIAYVASGSAFLLQLLTLPIGWEGTKLVSNSCFMLAAVSLSATAISINGRPVPWFAMGLLASGGLLAFSWFLLKDENLAWRVYSMNLALGGICLVAAAELRHAIRSNPIAKVFLVLSILAGLNFLIRPHLAATRDASFESYEGFYESLYWTSAVLTHGVLSLIIALSFLAAAVLDEIGAYRAEAMLDPLSGIPNRRGFERSVVAALRTKKPKALPAAVVIADLDHFKKVNDSFGHAVGDRVIVAFSQLLDTARSSGGIVGRIGGEEFAVFLPDADLGSARLFAERVRTAFSNIRVPGLPEHVRLSATFGISSRSHGEGISELLSHADKALYRAKRDGRDRIGLVYPRARTASNAVPSASALSSANSDETDHRSTSEQRDAPKRAEA